MSGNFDFPPARSPSSDSPLNPYDNPNHLPPIFQRTPTFSQSTSHTDQPGTNTQSPMSTRRRRTSRRPAASSSREGSIGLPNLPPPRPRPRANPGERYQTIQRLRQQQQLAMNTFDTGHRLLEAFEQRFEQSNEQLRQRSSELLQLMDHGSMGQYLPPPPGLRLGPLSSMDPETSRRTGGHKRRKLEHAATGSEFEGFSYGHFGQVVPGRLKMEIVSCDGGEYAEDSDTALYRAENVLRNDRSVYCTKSPRCNLLLRHQGETTFSLERLVIKAPTRGFTAPVQEGVIFVGMSSDEVWKQSEEYKVQHKPTSRSPSSSPEDEELSLMESLQDPGVLAGLRQGERARASAARERDRDRDRDHRIRRRLEDMHVTRRGQFSRTEPSAGEVCDWPLTEHDPPTYDPDTTTPPPFTISEMTDDEASEGDDDDSSGPTTARPPSRYGDMRRAYQATPRRPERRPDPMDGLDTAHSPSASFYMEKSKITIKFSTPVSAKFILLKLFSPVPHGNIDIECIAAHGFAGPRFFPSCQMR